jgi:DNA-binding CsgD family transcriptional regulator
MALARYPDLVPVGHAATATEGLRLGSRAHAVVVHGSVVGATVCMRRLHALGVRVVVVGDGPVHGPWPQVSTDAPLHELASFLAPDAALPDAALRTLTDREQQILSLAAKGLAGKQIARLLGISPKTVERHKTRTYAKLGVPNQAAAVGLLGRHSSEDGALGWNLSSM